MHDDMDDRLRRLERLVEGLVQSVLANQAEIRELRQELELARLDASLDVKLASFRMWPSYFTT
jgi:hypothetical protein